MVLQESHVLGISPKTGEVRVVMLFDKSFEVTSGFRQTQKRNSVLLTNLSRGLCYRTWTARKTREWTEEIQRLVTGEPGE